MKKLMLTCLGCLFMGCASAEVWLIDRASHEGMIKEALKAKFGQVDVRHEEADGYSGDRMYVEVKGYHLCYQRDDEEWVLYQVNGGMINVVYNYLNALDGTDVKTDEKGNKIVRMTRYGSGMDSEFEVSQEAFFDAVGALMMQRDAIFALIQAADERGASVAAEKLAAFQAKMAELSKRDAGVKSQILMVWEARQFMLMEDLNTLLMAEIMRVKNKDCYGSQRLKAALAKKAAELKGGFRSADSYRWYLNYRTQYLEILKPAKDKASTQKMLKKLHEHQKTFLADRDEMPPDVGNPVPVEICAEFIELHALSELIDAEYERLLTAKWYGAEL